MGKKWFYIVVLYIMVYMCGCGSITKEEPAAEGAQVQEETLQEEKKLRGEHETTEEAVVNEEFQQDDQHAATVLEDEAFLYFCGKNNIRKVNKTTLETEYIWENMQNKSSNDPYEYSGTGGILAADKLYFIEEWTEEEDTVSKWALSVVCTDGSGYERIESYEMNPSDIEESLLLLDGVLYYAVLQDGTMKGYSLDKDGVLLKTRKTTTKAENVPADYWNLYYYENGSKILSALESEKRFGYYLLRDEDYQLCIVDPETGDKEELPAAIKDYSLAAVNDDYFLFDNYTEEKMVLVDVKTLEYREFAEMDAHTSIITMDSDYVYLQSVHEGDDFTQYKYLRIDLENGYKEEAFTVDAFVGMDMSSPWFFMDISIKNNYIYYVGEQDYKLYLMRRSMDMPNAEEILGEAFYDTGICQVGEVQSYKEKIYSAVETEKVTGELDLEWLVVDEQYAGADKINQILLQEQEANISYLRNNAGQYDEWEEFDLPGFSFTSNVSPVYYMDGRYLSYVQQNYDYSGGAHGMPYWIAHTFDLESGKELMLSDIIEDDDTVVKEVVSRYFTEMYNREKDAYWGDAVEIVQENTSLQSPFYLSEDGIVFYYGPYELAPYAGGFKEVTVPYEEIKLKINLPE